MSSFTSTLSLNLSIIDARPRFTPVSPTSPPPVSAVGKGGVDERPRFTPVSPTYPPPVLHAGKKSPVQEKQGWDSDEEELPYHIRWADELARRSRRNPTPAPMPNTYTRQTTSMVVDGQVVYNGDPKGNRIVDCEHMIMNDDSV